MKGYLRHARRLMMLFGVDPRKTINTLRGLPPYWSDLRTLKRQQRTSNVCFPFGRPWPCLNERFSDSGTAKGDYFHQDLLIARRIFANSPKLHVDIGSRIDGFVAHVASFREIEVFDIRPLESNIPNVKFTRADLMGELDKALVDYCDSLSCLHALEHFGLGRYGDPVKFEGYLDGLNNMYMILKKNGKFYFSVPIGPQQIRFNAHRVFSVEHLLELFDGKYTIDIFSYVDDGGDLYENVQLTNSGVKDNFGCHYGCGIFEMTKL
ncbi:MAG: DUF268 domain-containing protein [Phycisphaerales bacterium]|nr:MAG: DUF268 domain-containing protein [Phycisphaerales bacterium]